MRIELSCNHDAKLDDLVELLTTDEGLARMPPGFIQAPEVDRSATGGGSRVRWRQSFELDPRDSPSRLMSHLVQVDVLVDWTVEAGRAVGRISTRIAGAPVRAGAVHTIEPTEDGCRSTIALDLSSQVPMLGGRLLASVERTARRQVEHFLRGLDLGLNGQPR